MTLPVKMTASSQAPLGPQLMTGLDVLLVQVEGERTSASLPSMGRENRGTMTNIDNAIDIRFVVIRFIPISL
jgi:hypothetical protein